MSLIVHLPLNGTTKQIGLSSLTFAGSPSAWNNGKIGKCAYWNGSVNNVIYNNTTELNYTENFSVALWINPVRTGTNTQYAFTVGRADMGGYGYGLQVDSATQIAFRFGNKSIAMSVNSNEWSHIAMIVGASDIKVYKNGTLYTTTAIGTKPTYSDGNGIGLGCFHHASNIYPYYGSMNDFRIYDHCLSPMEVKQLSQGLVLHYPLDRSGWGQENLLRYQIGESQWTNWSNAPSTREKVTIDGKTWAHIIQTSSSGYGGYCCEVAYNNIVIDNTKKYTWSCTAKAGTSTNAEIILWYHLRSTEGGANISQSTKRFALTSTPQRVSYTIDPSTVSSSYTINRINLMMGTSGTANNEVYFTDIKFEEGEISTPWCPNSADTLATTMGMNNNIEYDCSGYCNNGTRVGTFSWTSDTPKYNVSTTFPSGTNYIDCGASQVVLPTDAITVNLWTNYSTWGNPISCTEGGGWNFENSSGNIQFPLYVASVGYKVANSGVAISSLQNGWHMLTGTFDKTNVKIYIDGVLKATTATGSTNGIGYAANHCYVGAEAGGTTTVATTAFVGNISDVRIYATALSADDVKALYNNSAYIDNDGNVYAADYLETSNTALNSQGVFNTLEINEETEQAMIKNTGELYSPDFYEI